MPRRGARRPAVPRRGVRRRGAPGRAAGALTAAAVGLALLVTGCSGGGEERAGEDGGGGAAEPAAATSSPADDGIPEETVPTDELTPPAGTFAEEEVAYLTDRVPEGVDPGAILQLGQEACDRLGYLDRHDPDALVAALRDGEIPNAEPAVEHLCPEYADALAEATG
ncbi:hypothetical protein ACTWP5_06995 [Streptomyces sp. 4N509B]|uniref:hypothetical protein n=1 Tax=Streptomyces sp. 4N509B TaxID=3457413 RepID=UPI003FD24BAD